MTTELGEGRTDPEQTMAGAEVLAPRWADIPTLSVVIPALNEEANIPDVMQSIPYVALAEAHCEVEVVVVDNRSVDRTAEVAASLGANVVCQPVRGYGNAYLAGFAVAKGEVVVTGDADCTYPFDAIPQLLDYLSSQAVDFLSTNRLGQANRHAMKRSHTFGNFVLTATSRRFFRAPFRDSQSGMWVFRRSIWPHLDVRSGGMAFSQEIKNEAYVKGFRCAEVPIEYRERRGAAKLNAFRDGARNLNQLTAHRIRTARRSTLIPVVPSLPSLPPLPSGPPAPEFD